MDRFKTALSFWPVLLIVSAILGIGYSANALQASKVSVESFGPFQKETEKRLTKVEDAANSYGEDIKLIKNQMWMIAIATHAAIVPQPLPKTIPDGGVK